MKVVVTGANGQLGYDVLRALSEADIEYLGTTSDMMDITNESAVREVLISYKPDVVIHCAAYTNVDMAEEEAEACFLINATGTKYIAKVCQQIDAKLLYISTDYVFSGDGESFHKVDDIKEPRNIYGASKLAGENFVKEYVRKHFVVRTSWVFGSHGKNFVKTMIRLGQNKKEVKVVCDQVGSPTYTYDLAELIVSMIQSNKYGTYHAHNEGICSWADFARMIFKLKGMDTVVTDILTNEYITKATRPLNSRLDMSDLNKNGFRDLPSWKDALKRYMEYDVMD